VESERMTTLGFRAEQKLAAQIRDAAKRERRTVSNWLRRVVELQLQKETRWQT